MIDINPRFLVDSMNPVSLGPLVLAFGSKETRFIGQLTRNRFNLMRDKRAVNHRFLGWPPRPCKYPLKIKVPGGLKPRVELARKPILISGYSMPWP
jgi:hypothetical protein